MRTLVVAGILVGAVWAAGPAAACSVPVFRYALERWAPEPYQVYVFHRGPLSAPDQAVADRLKALAPGVSDAGAVLFQTIDLDASPEEGAMEVWLAQTAAAPPWVVVRYPEVFGIPHDVWSGPLTAPDVAALLDSPARRDIARRLLTRDSAVFVLLASGDLAQDDRVGQLLATELARLEQAITLPEPPDGQWGDPVYDRQGAPNLKIAFSVLTLSRTDPAERLFVRMLVGCEPELDTTPGPIVLPIFGRGRALCALAGEGINARNLEAVCEFLGGPCSCVIKYDNPGVDMLFTVDWAAALEGQESAIPEVKPPPLTGLADFAAPAAPPAADAPADPRASLVRNVALAVGGGMLVLAVLGLVMWRKTRPARP